MLKALLKLIVQKDGSDLYLSSGVQPSMKVNGTLYKIGKQILTGEDIAKIGTEIMNAEQAKAFELVQAFESTASVANAKPQQQTFSAKANMKPAQTVESCLGTQARQGDSSHELRETACWNPKQLQPFVGASEAEAMDDPGCALVSLNEILKEEGHGPFTEDEVRPKE